MRCSTLTLVADRSRPRRPHRPTDAAPPTITAPTARRSARSVATSPAARSPAAHAAARRAARRLPAARSRSARQPQRGVLEARRRAARSTSAPTTCCEERRARRHGADRGVGLLPRHHRRSTRAVTAARHRWSPPEAQGRSSCRWKETCRPGHLLLRRDRTSCVGADVRRAARTC